MHTAPQFVVTTPPQFHQPRRSMTHHIGSQVMSYSPPVYLYYPHGDHPQHPPQVQRMTSLPTSVVMYGTPTIDTGPGMVDQHYPSDYEQSSLDSQVSSGVVRALQLWDLKKSPL